MFTDAKSIVDYLNTKVLPNDPTAKAYVAGINAEDVVMEFYYIGGKTLTLPAFQSDGITAVTLPANLKVITPKCQKVNVTQSGNAIA